MFVKIGRKLVKGAKAELQESPVIFNPDRILDLVEAGIAVIALGLMIFGGGRTSKGTTTVINNIYINGIKQQ